MSLLLLINTKPNCRQISVFRHSSQSSLFREHHWKWNCWDFW